MLDNYEEEIDYNEEDEISERSYHVCNKYENVTEKWLNTTISLKWLFASACINFILYAVETYQLTFSPNFKHSISIYIVLFFCNIFVYVDIYANLMRSYMKFPNKKFVYQENSKGCLILDLLSLYTIIVEVLNVTNPSAIQVKIVLLLLRNYKIPLYHSRVSLTDHVENVIIFVSKYILIYIFIMHSFTCLFLLSCFCDEKHYPEKSFFDKYLVRRIRQRNLEDYEKGLRDSKYMSPTELYSVVSYFIIGSMSHIGFGNPTNDVEVAICGSVILICIFFNIVLIGDLSAMIMESNSDQAEFTNRLSLIKKYMKNEKFTKKIRKRILRYYLKFWQRNSSYRTKFYLAIIPPAMQTELLLDQFWFAIHQAFIFKDETLAMKRGIASVMKIEHFNKGDSVTNIVDIRDKIFFIARGSVSILSLEDNESSLISLGVGTSFGNLNLVYNYVDKCSVVAETYCILHTLQKYNFWQLKELKCFRRSKNIFEKMRIRLEMAKMKTLSKNRVDVQEKTLIRVKKMLKDVGSYNIYDERNVCHIGRHSEAYDGYILNKRIDINIDALFIRTIWPWKLRNNTSLTNTWELIIIISTFVLLIAWPLNIYFYLDLDSVAMDFMRIYYGTIFIMDIIIQLSTAVDTSTGLRIQFSEILEVRCSTWLFLFDVLAAIPLDTMLMLIDFESGDLQKTTRIIVLSLRLLKVSRLPKYLTQLELKYVNINKVFFKCVKHFFIGITATYIIGLLYYLRICFHGPTKCREGSVIKNIALKDKAIEHNAFIRLVYACFFSLMLVTQNTLFFVGVLHQLHFIYIISLFGLYMFQYALSELAATGLLSKSIWNKHLIKTINTQRYTILRKFPMHLRLRVLYYLEAQWLYDSGLRNRDLFFDLPNYLYNEQQSLYYKSLCKEIPLFQSLDSQAIKTIASRCTTIFLPPGEIVVYKGVTVNDMYIIRNGCCEIVSEIGGKLKRILSTKDHFCSLNMLFKIPLVFDIKTLTYVSLVKISREDCMYAFKMNPNYYAALQNLIDETTKELNEAGRLFNVVQTRPIPFNRISAAFKKWKIHSWCIFQQTEYSDFLYMDYLKKFKEHSIYGLLKYVMMKRTIIPNGAFCFYWEYFRTFCVWLTCMITPVLYIYQVYFPNINIFTIILFLIFIVDIYLQMHVCYFSEKGLIVTHPIYTCKNYLRGRFFLDIIGVLPLGHAFIYVWIEIKPIVAAKYAACASLLKFTMLLRSRCLLQKTKTFRKQSLWVTFPYAVMIFTSLYNFFACIYMLSTGEFYEYKTDVFTVRPKKDSWVYNTRIRNGQDLSSPMIFYIICLKMATSNILLLGYVCNDTHLDLSEKIISMISTIIGYLIAFAFVVRDPWDSAVSNFFISQGDLKRFFKNNKISKTLTKSTIDYLDYIWRYTLCIRSKDLKHLPETIQQDIVLCVYGSTLLSIVPFKHMGTESVRTMGLNFDEVYIMAGMDIILVNDIVENIFIVHRGAVEVVAADGTVLKSMVKGSLFGNVDNVAMSRSMVKVRAVNNVELMMIKTSEFYNLISGYKDVVNRFNNSILLNNVSYIPSTLEHKNIVRITKTKFETIIESINNIKRRDGYELIFYTINYLYVSYYVTYPYVARVEVIFYLMDMIMCGNIALNICGAYISSRKKKKKKLNWYVYKYFYLDVISVVPIELLPLIIEGKQKIYYMFHMNRLLRIVHIANFVVQIGKRVDKNFYRIKILMLICFITITIHSGACLFYWTAFTTTMLFGEMTWLKKMMCQRAYFCSVYYSLSTFSFRGHHQLSPVSIYDLVVHMTFATGCKYMLATLNGNILSLLSHFGFGVTKFNNGVQKLTRALKRSNVCQKLIENVLHYTHQVWLQNSGHHFPSILSQAPRNMISQIKMEAFGNYLFMHPIFGDCHVDFLRQLVGKMKLVHYFPSDVICHKGDINSTMYFIKSGVVEVVDVLKSVEIVIDILQTDDSFGMLQGLVNCKEHVHTFRATHVTNILSLEYKDWSYLLHFFPASKFSIYNDIITRIVKTQT